MMYAVRCMMHHLKKPIPEFEQIPGRHKMMKAVGLKQYGTAEQMFIDSKCPVPKLDPKKVCECVTVLNVIT